jgi:cell division septation protein DedD
VSSQNLREPGKAQSTLLKPRFTRCLVVAFLALVMTAVGGFCDPLIRSAQTAQKAGDASLAAGTYRDWLHMNPGAPGSARVFAAYFSTEADLPTLLAESRAFLASAKGCAGAGEQFRRIARLFDLAGLVEEARDAYREAWSEDSSAPSLVAAAFLSLEMNDVAALAAILTDARGTPAEPLAAALSAGQGYDGLAALASQTGDPDLALKARWVLSRLALARGDTGASSAELGRLASQFGASPEAALSNSHGAGSPAQGSQVVLATSAYAVLAAAPPLPAAPASSDASAPAPIAAAAPSDPPASPDAAQPPQNKGSYAVQAGSFQVKENADDLSAELLKRGFSPAIVHDLLQGKDRFRVLAGSALALDQAKALLGRLTGAGYAGFLIAQP